MILLWFLAGVLLSGLSLIGQVWTVNRLDPYSQPPWVWLWLVAAPILRWVLVVGLLVIALRQGVEAGLLTFLGLWLGRSGGLAWIIYREQDFVVGG